jgi:hypothetical protein
MFKKIIKFFLVAILFFSVFCLGYYIRIIHGSRAIKGCELAAFQVMREERICRYQFEKFRQICAGNIKNIIKNCNDYIDRIEN